MTAHSIPAVAGWTFRGVGADGNLCTLTAHFLLAFGAILRINQKTHQDNTFHSKRDLWKH